MAGWLQVGQKRCFHENPERERALRVKVTPLFQELATPQRNHRRSNQQEQKQRRMKKTRPRELQGDRKGLESEPEEPDLKQELQHRKQN